MKNEKLQELYEGAIQRNKDQTGRMNMLCNTLYCEVNRLESELEEKDFQIQCLTKFCEKKAREEEESLRSCIKIGSEFWELNTANALPSVYPRVIQSEHHITYFWENYKDHTFLTEDEAKRALKRWLDTHTLNIIDSMNAHVKVMLKNSSDAVQHYAAAYIAALESIVSSIA